MCASPTGFAIEILLGRIDVPPSDNPTSLVAKRELSLVTELTTFVQEAAGSRDARMESVILPRCQELIQAIGYRFAFDDAVAQGVDPQLIELFVASVMTYSEGWCAGSENIPLSRQRLRLLEAADAIYPRLDSLLERWKIAPYVTAPIVSDEKWTAYVQSMESYGSSPDNTTHTGSRSYSQMDTVGIIAKARL